MTLMPPSPSKSSKTSSKPSSSIWKGKARAVDADAETDADYTDLNPTITYRHLLSHNLGVRDPLRVVALCDSDAFYAACEQIRLGIDPNKPLVVQQWDSLIAVNYPARKFGITRMAKVKDALKACPELVVVHVATYREGEAEPGYWENPDTLTHKVSLDHYRRESMKIIQIFKDGLPTGEIEKASIDEAFIDFTRPAREEILRRYPHLAQIPPDAPDGADTPLPPPPPIISWDGVCTLIPVDPASTPQDEPESADNPAPPPLPPGDDSPTTWHDVALSIAAELMEKIRATIRTQLGYTTSAGIARNKFLAKLTASHRKPNAQSVLRNAAIPAYLRPLPFQKIRFLGGKLGKALAEEYDAATVGDLLGVGLEEMQRKFGEESIWVWELLRGIDRGEVKEKPAVTKSMLASKNLLHPVTKSDQGFHWIRVLAAELALRLNEARDADPGLWPKSIVLHVRHGYDAFRSKQAAFPFTRSVTVDHIAAAGDKLWRELVGAEDKARARNAMSLKITNVQLSFSGIGSMEAGQRSIEGFFGARKDEGQDASVEESSTGGGKPSSKREREDEDVDVPHPPKKHASERSFLCAQCSKRIALPDIFDIDGAIAQEHELEGEERFERLRIEHADWHLAQELARQARNEDRETGRVALKPLDKPRSAGQTEGKKKGATKKAEKGTLTSFFGRR